MNIFKNHKEDHKGLNIIVVGAGKVGSTLVEQLSISASSSSWPTPSSTSKPGPMDDFTRPSMVTDAEETR